MTRKNPTGAPKKSRVKIVFPVSIAAKNAAGCAAVSGTTDANSDPVTYSLELGVVKAEVMKITHNMALIFIRSLFR